MMDWIRNYDTSNEEYTRRIRFTCHDGVNDLAKRILEIGDPKMQENKPKDSDDFESRSSGLSRSKSDHRLVSEFRRQEENASPPVRRRAFGENRYSREANKSRTNLGRYGGDDEEDESTGRSGRFRSRFLRGDEEEESDRRNSRHLDEEPTLSKKERNKVIETEDASRGPLSGCIRLADSSRVIQRLKEREMELARPPKKETPPPAPKPKPAAAPVPAPRTGGSSRQDDDEIDRIKQENKAKEEASSTTTTTA